MDALNAQIEQELIERDELLNSVDSNTRAYLLSCKGWFDFISITKRLASEGD